MGRVSSFIVVLVLWSLCKDFNHFHHLITSVSGSTAHDLDMSAQSLHDFRFDPVQQIRDDHDHSKIANVDRYFEQSNPAPRSILHIKDEAMLHRIVADSTISLEEHRVGEQAFTDRVKSKGYSLLVSSDGAGSIINVINITFAMVCANVLGNSQKLFN